MNAVHSELKGKLPVERVLPPPSPPSSPLLLSPLLCIFLFLFSFLPFTSSSLFFSASPSLLPLCMAVCPLLWLRCGFVQKHRAQRPCIGHLNSLIFIPVSRFILNSHDPLPLTHAHGVSTKINLFALSDIWLTCFCLQMGIHVPPQGWLLVLHLLQCTLYSPVPMCLLHYALLGAPGR